MSPRALISDLYELQATALFYRDCLTDRTGLACRLAPVLHGLYVVAAVLAVILVIVIAVAVLIYRKRSVDRSTVL